MSTTQIVRFEIPMPGLGTVEATHQFLCHWNTPGDVAPIDAVHITAPKGILVAGYVYQLNGIMILHDTPAGDKKAWYPSGGLTVTSGTNNRNLKAVGNGIIESVTEAFNAHVEGHPEIFEKANTLWRKAKLLAMQERATYLRSPTTYERRRYESEKEDLRKLIARIRKYRDEVKEMDANAKEMEDLAQAYIAQYPELAEAVTPS